MSFGSKLSQIALSAQSNLSKEKKTREKEEADRKSAWLQEHRPTMLALKERLLKQAEEYASNGHTSMTYEVNDINEDFVPELVDLLRKEGLSVSSRMVRTRDITDSLVDMPELTINW